jgi:hypothetical protein
MMGGAPGCSVLPRQMNDGRSAPRSKRRGSVRASSNLDALFADDLNLHRRHLSREQMRLFIERRLQRTPEQSNNKIAAELGVADKTVGAVRRQLESTSEIPKLDRTIGPDGKARTARRRRATVVRGVGLRQAARIAAMAADIASAAAADRRHTGPAHRLPPSARADSIPPMTTRPTRSPSCCGRSKRREACDERQPQDRPRTAQRP